jgi:hypothetical protein
LVSCRSALASIRCGRCRDARNLDVGRSRLLFLGLVVNLVHAFRRLVGELGAGIAAANDFVIEVRRRQMIGPAIKLGHFVIFLSLLQLDADQLPFHALALFAGRQFGIVTQGLVNEHACLGDLAAVVACAAGA